MEGQKPEQNLFREESLIGQEEKDAVVALFDKAIETKKLSVTTARKKISIARSFPNIWAEDSQMP